MSNGAYIFSSLGDQTEYERLQLQERTIDWVSQGRLAALGLGVGSVCLEAGVGAGSVLRWMALQAGPTGRVVGFDLDDRFFRASERPNVELRKADLRTAPLEKSSFDFIHARLLFLHLAPADRALVAGRFLEALKPGGWLVALDPAYGFPVKAPTTRGEELWAKFLGSIVMVTSPHADFTLGEHLPQLLLDSGFTAVEGFGHFPMPTVGGVNHIYLFNVVDTYRAMSPTLLAGRPAPMTDEELDELVACLEAGDVTTAWPACTVWGDPRPRRERLSSQWCRDGTACDAASTSSGG